MADPKNGNTTTKSAAYAQAVAKATGQELTVTGADSGLGEVAVLDAIPPGYGEMAKPYTPEEAAIEIAKGQLEWAPRVLQFVEGMLVEGILEGRGGDVELEEVLTDPITREKKIVTKIVSTWVMRAERTGLRASFLTAAQLEDKLPPFVGSFVKIYVGKMRESKKGHRYRDYLVGGAKLATIDAATGKPMQRTFARALPPAPAPGRIIDAELAEDLIAPQAS